MREPESWSDKSLLEDEPFLSAFKARQLAAPPTRRGAGPAGEDDDDARDRAIATTIREMKLVSFFHTIYVLQATSQTTVHNGASLA